MVVSPPRSLTAKRLPGRHLALRCGDPKDPRGGFVVVSWRSDLIGQDKEMRCTFLSLILLLLGLNSVIWSGSGQ